MEKVAIQYRFTISSGIEDVFNLRFDPQKMELFGFAPEILPHWTKLEFHQCDHCTFSSEQQPHCPVAANLATIIDRFEKLISYDELHLDVVTDERIISQNTTAQRAISSLMGLIIATSPCPHTAFFKPMARFHLPLATEKETIIRATSTYLLSQYFHQNDGQVPDWEMAELSRIYKNMQTVNITLAERIRATTATDSSLNAIIQLDMFAKALPFVIKDSLEEIRRHFTPFLEKGNENRKE